MKKLLYLGIVLMFASCGPNREEIEAELEDRIRMEVKAELVEENKLEAEKKLQEEAKAKSTLIEKPENSFVVEQGNNINQLSQKGVITPGQALVAKANQEMKGLSDYSEYATPYAYDASPTGTNIDRYKAYGQETFNKLGFDPLIDNETWYNQNK